MNPRRLARDTSLSISPGGCPESAVESVFVLSVMGYLRGPLARARRRNWLDEASDASRNDSRSPQSVAKRDRFEGHEQEDFP